MATKKSNDPQLKLSPASGSRWADLEALFGERGACGGCWCMFWRVPRKQFDAGKGAKNKSALKKIRKIRHPLGAQVLPDMSGVILLIAW